MTSILYSSLVNNYNKGEKKEVSDEGDVFWMLDTLSKEFSELTSGKIGPGMRIISTILNTIAMWAPDHC